MSAVILDNEAVRALADPRHPKHRTVLSFVAGTASRRRKGVPVTVIVPTAVRVEAAWDRTAPAAAFINRLPVRDSELDAAAANQAAAIQRDNSVGVADAHLAVTVRQLPPQQIVVLTSDPGDITRVCAPVATTVVAI